MLRNVTPSPGRRSGLGRLALAGLCVLVAAACQPGAVTPVPLATLRVLDGEVRVSSNAQAPAELAVDGAPVEAGLYILTGSAGEAEILLPGANRVHLLPESWMRVEQLWQSGDRAVTLALRLLAGQVLVSSSPGQEIAVYTPMAEVSLPNAFGRVEYGPNRNTLLVQCLRGQCAVRNGVIDRTLEACQQVVIVDNGLHATQAAISVDDLAGLLEVDAEVAPVLATRMVAPTATPTATRTPVPSPTPTDTRTPTPTATIPPTETATSTPRPTATATPRPTNPPRRPTGTPVPSETPTALPTATATSTLEPPAPPPDPPQPTAEPTAPPPVPATPTAVPPTATLESPPTKTPEAPPSKTPAG
jgi:hypothetical protein